VYSDISLQPVGAIWIVAYDYAGWTKDENFLKVRMNFCSDELEESVLLLVFVIQRQNERYFCDVFGLATFTDCTPGGLIPEILNTNTNTNTNPEAPGLGEF
jgi:hypothetical protein